jgi:hypothetical protein
MRLDFRVIGASCIGWLEVSEIWRVGNVDSAPGMGSRAGCLGPIWVLKR